MGTINSAKIWPYAIIVAILTFFGAIVFSIVLIVKEAPVQKDNMYMLGYDHADLRANERIQAEIDFNKKYKIAYITESLPQVGAIIKYKVTTLDGVSIDNAKVSILITRPEHHNDDQHLENPSVSDGVYTFAGFTLEHPGRWNILAKVSVENDERIFSVKADTRAKEAFEY